jgi:hypothetical protein
MAGALPAAGGVAAGVSEVVGAGASVGGVAGAVPGAGGSAASFGTVYCNTGSQVIGIYRYSVIAITLCDIWRYRIMYFHSIAKLSFLNVIARGT